MSARPGEWHLLGYDSDPVPGDPGAVLTEGTHYTQTAQTIAGQVARLRQLAQPDAALKGSYAEQLQQSCSDLAGHLEQIHGRFDTVGSQLTAFEPDLTTARTQTKAALDDAVAAQSKVAANQPGPTRDPSAPPLTPDQQHAEDTRAKNHQAGMDELGAAKSKAANAMSAFNQAADSTANAIRKASDDELKDDLWDGFLEWAHEHAQILDTIADVLGWIATALTIIALLIPGLNVFVAVLLLTVGALAIHTLLAANGDGSWVDVVMDVISLATIGMGTAGLKMANAGRKAGLKAAGEAAKKQAAKEVLAKASYNGGKGFFGGANKLFLRLFSPSVNAKMAAAGEEAFTAVTSRALPKVTVSQAIKVGLDRELASLIADKGLIAAQYGSKAIPLSYSAGTTIARISATTAALLDLTQKGLGGKFFGIPLYTVPPWESFKNKFKWTVGGPL